jgi:hypothetical protein
MTNARKVRGMATQAMIAADLREEGIYPFATDAGAGRPGADILNTPGISCEVKARTNFDPVAALRQATKNAAEGETPIVVVRMNGQGEAKINDWVAFMRWEDMKEFIKWKSGVKNVNAS